MSPGAPQQKKPKEGRILIVDDEETIRQMLQQTLQALGYQVWSAGDADLALELIEKTDIELAIVDIMLPGMNGIELLLALQKKAPDAQVILITGHPAISTAAEAIRGGAFDYVLKPFQIEDLTRRIESALAIGRLTKEKKLLAAENLKYQKHLEELVDERSRELQESETRYRTLVENQGEGIGILDTQNNFVFLNPAAHDILGQPPEKIIGRCLFGLIDERNREKIEEETKKRRTGQKSTYELEIIRAGNQKRQLLITATPQFDER